MVDVRGTRTVHRKRAKAGALCGVDVQAYIHVKRKKLNSAEGSVGLSREALNLNDLSMEVCRLYVVTRLVGQPEPRTWCRGLAPGVAGDLFRRCRPSS